jgi:hypothetical protein
MPAMQLAPWITKYQAPSEPIFEFLYIGIIEAHTGRA